MHNHEGQDKVYVIEYHKGDKSMVIGVVKTKSKATEVILKHKEEGGSYSITEWWAKYE